MLFTNSTGEDAELSVGVWRPSINNTCSTEPYSDRATGTSGVGRMSEKLYITHAGCKVSCRYCIVMGVPSVAATRFQAAGYTTQERMTWPIVSRLCCLFSKPETMA